MTCNTAAFPLTFSSLLSFKYQLHIVFFSNLAEHNSITRKDEVTDNEEISPVWQHLRLCLCPQGI